MKTQTKEFEGIPVLELSGRFDAHTVPQVSDWIKIKMADQPRLVIDLVECDLCRLGCSGNTGSRDEAVP